MLRWVPLLPTCKLWAYKSLNTVDIRWRANRSGGLRLPDWRSTADPLKSLGRQIFNSSYLGFVHLVRLRNLAHFNDVKRALEPSIFYQTKICLFALQYAISFMSSKTLLASRYSEFLFFNLSSEILQLKIAEYYWIIVWLNWLNRGGGSVVYLRA